MDVSYMNLIHVLVSQLHETQHWRAAAVAAAAAAETASGPKP